MEPVKVTCSQCQVQRILIEKDREYQLARSVLDFNYICKSCLAEACVQMEMNASHLDMQMSLGKIWSPTR